MPDLTGITFENKPLSAVIHQAALNSNFTIPPEEVRAISKIRYRQPIYKHKERKGKNSKAISLKRSQINREYWVENLKAFNGSCECLHVLLILLLKGKQLFDEHEIVNKHLKNKICRQTYLENLLFILKSKLGYYIRKNNNHYVLCQDALELNISEAYQLCIGLIDPTKVKVLSKTRKNRPTDIDIYRLYLNELSTFQLIQQLTTRPAIKSIVGKELSNLINSI